MRFPLHMSHLRRAWFYARSFVVRSRTLDDYPVSYRPMIDYDGTGTPGHLARIDGLFQCFAAGKTKAEAREALRANLADRAREEPLPRPGVYVPVQYLPSPILDRYPEIRDDVYDRVLRMNIAFAADSAAITLYGDLAEFNRRTMLLYGIDLEQLPDITLGTLVQTIAERGRGGLSGMLRS